MLARAPGTVNMYVRAFRKWKEFALRKKEWSYFPANPMHVAVYLQSGEVTSIRRSHIKFLEDHMIIKVEKNKTDQLRFLASR